MKVPFCIFFPRFARHVPLALLLLLVVLAQQVPGWGEYYARYLYPQIAASLSGFSGIVPFAVGDMFIAVSIAGLLFYPFYARLRLHRRWMRIWGCEVRYLLWVYVWFYAAWGLNYSQNGFYRRAGIPPAAYTLGSFQRFTDRYITALNASYTTLTLVNADVIRREVVQGYREISTSLGVHSPFNTHPRVKAMLFTPLASMVGASGSMGPFFCEFTVNGDVPASEYPAVYAHEFSHLLGITNEAEANFYAYEVCTRSQISGIRFSGYFSVLYHVLGNARRLLPEEEYRDLLKRIRPEVLEHGKHLQQYWQEKYNPFIGQLQDRIYELYLKSNKISSGRKNYSEVVGLLIAYEEWKAKS